MITILHDGKPYCKLSSHLEGEIEWTPSRGDFTELVFEVTTICVTCDAVIKKGTKQYEKIPFPKSYGTMSLGKAVESAECISCRKKEGRVFSE